MAKLTARPRQGTGKSVTRKLRASGEVPAIAYGHGQEGRALTVNAHELQMLLGSINADNTIIELEIEGGKPVQALIREVQHHPSRPYIQHVDFFQVKAGEKLHVEVPIHLHGTPIGVREGGGTLAEVLRVVSVECLPKDIPAGIDLDINDLGVGESLHVSDVTLPNVTILTDAALVICSVSAQSGAAAAEVADEAAAE